MRSKTYVVLFILDKLQREMRAMINEFVCKQRTLNQAHCSVRNERLQSDYFVQ